MAIAAQDHPASDDEEYEDEDADADDYEDEEDDDDVEDEEEDEDCDEEDDEEEEDSDSISDGRSSGSGYNNRDGGRVCDCCYCEVFGHGMPPSAATSRNYSEMRERLRQRLSKRKAERGTNVTNNTCGTGAPVSNGSSTVLTTSIEVASRKGGRGGRGFQSSPETIQDDRDVEALVSYINGTKSNIKNNQHHQNGNNNCNSSLSNGKQKQEK